MKFGAVFRTALTPYLLLVMVPGLLYLGNLIQSSHRTRFRNEERQMVVAESFRVRASLEASLYSTLYLGNAMQALVALKPDMSQEEFSRAVAPMMYSYPEIRNISMAPGMVISYVHPLDGNRGALGLDFRKNSLQRDSAFLARDLRKVVVAGPINLVQGGEGIVARVPVYLGPEKESFWGLASVVIDTEKLYRNSGLAADGAMVDFALKGRDAKGSSGEVFFGDPDIFHGDPVLADITLPYGSWVLAAIPKGGWSQEIPPETSTTRWFLLVSTVLILMVLGLTWMELKHRQARLDAQTSSRTKSEFLANMSHEIRTPLNAVIGFTSLLQETEVDPDRQQFLRSARDAGKMLLTLVNDILDLSKIEAGKLKLIPVVTDLRNLAEEVISLLSFQAVQKNLELKGDLEGLVGPPVMVDQVRLRQILINLVSNGIKFTESGSVTLKVRKTINHYFLAQVFLSVEDTGIGMDRELCARLFTPFTQADSSTTRKYGGTGLGLTISQKLAEALGSRIMVESSPGQGSVFSLQLVLESAQETTPPEDFPGEGNGTLITQGTWTLLLVEDVTMNLKLLKAYLHRINPEFRMIEAVNGAEALEAFTTEKPDLVLMDVQMPGMDGLEATRRIRALEAGGSKRVPILALTAGALPEEESKAREAGMDCFLTKPLDLEKLTQALVRWLPKGPAQGGKEP